MCDQPGLEYAQMTYTDMSSSKVTTKRLSLLNGKMAIVEVPQVTSYSRKVAFYDANGNKYE